MEDDLLLQEGATPQPKVDKEVVNYRAGNEIASCATCVNFIDGQCTQVEGTISPGAVCDLYQNINQGTKPGGAQPDLPIDIADMLIGE